MMKQKKHSVFGNHRKQSAFMKSKKGADLSMNVIIIAAIALLVLVILAVLLFRSADKVNTGTACEGFGGKCYYEGSQPEGSIKNLANSKDCPGDLNFCYIAFGDS